MGVDYLQCDGCDFGYRDDSEYAIYCDCGCKFCRVSCGELDNCLNFEEVEKMDDNDPRVDAFNDGMLHINQNKPITCVVCRKEKATDYVLLQVLLDYYQITKEQAIEIWRNQK